jgi:hypothetical protein
MTRGGVARLRRNLAVAVGNAGDPEAVTMFAETAESPLHALASDPLVAEHVEWATRKLRQ